MASGNQKPVIGDRFDHQELRDDRPEQEPAPIVIRPMKLEDLDQVVALDQRAFAMPWPASAYRYELVENPQSLLWIAQADQLARVAGVVVVWLILDEAHIATIAVEPEYRRQGIGRQLLAVALKDAIRHGSVSATLEVRAHNLGAQLLYHQFGFRIVGTRPHYYRDNNEDALLMTVSGLDKLREPLEAGGESRSYLEWLDQGRWAVGDTWS